MLRRSTFNVTPFFQDLKALPPLPKKLPRTSKAAGSKFRKPVAIACHAQERQERRMHAPENLNTDQRRVFDYIQAPENSESLTLIQAGPGRGKTFTMLSVAHARKANKQSVHVIIYKKDLLSVFQNCATTHTVCSMLMYLFDVGRYECQALEKQVCRRMSKFEFAATVLQLLRRASAPMPTNSLVIIDEYTVINKPMLFVLLLWLKKHRIQTVVCGDQFQLQAISESTHSTLSSYQIVRSFADETFELNTNERCSEAHYNEMLDLFAEFATGRPLCDFGYALVCAFFPWQLISTISAQQEPNVIHLAGTHRELANAKFHLMLLNQWPCSLYQLQFPVVGASSQRRAMASTRDYTTDYFYPPPVSKYIRQREVLTGPTAAHSPLIQIDGFLPFLPLIVGAKYFHPTFSEQDVVTLTEVDLQRETVKVKNKNGDLLTLGLSSCKQVMFDKHAEFLTAGSLRWSPGDGQPDQDLSLSTASIINFPIYPTFMLSIHKSWPFVITLSDSCHQFSIIAWNC